ncbi:TetR/AcrR family transcriptional regulator [Pseudoroseomonas globiformis]|uniref:TetR/AcrR family transcriptional regulator n=1 Tax=Teichococcus globiformis TaxID=2307229 RepID=A0ABV7FWP9_9PROT
MSSRDDTSSLPSRPQRRRLPVEERTPQILDAALEEFAARGYAGARMAEVARRAGIAKGLIYHYFPSKTELFQATVRACTRPTFEAAERSFAAHPGSAREVLRTLVDLGYDKAGNDPRDRTLFRLLITEAANVPELAAFYREEVLSRSLGIVRRLLAEGAASGEFRPDLPDAPGYAEVVLAPVLMLPVWQMMLGEQDAPAPEAMRAAHHAMLMAALSR